MDTKNDSIIKEKNDTDKKSKPVKDKKSKPVKDKIINLCKGCNLEKIKSARYCGSCVIYRS